jgi:hypothetical protein
MKTLRVMSAVTVATATAVCIATPAAADPYPEAHGRYTTPDDPGWVYFLSPPGYGGSRDGRAVNQFGCGIGPSGTVGCDAVPDSEQISDEPPTPVPLDANQTIADPQQPARYVHSDTLTFTRDVDVLPEGHQLVNGAAFCLVGYQGSVSCTTGDHGFTHYSIFGYTH